MQSPCNNICKLEVHSGERVCIGCGRTVDEIAGWAGFSNAKRAEVMQRLAAKKSTASGSTQKASNTPLA